MSIESRRNAAGAMRYTVRVKHAGRTVATRTFGRKGDAETWEREQYRALQLGDFIPPNRSSRPFSQVAQEFLEARKGQIEDHSWRTDRDNLKALPTWFSGRPISVIGESDILRVLTEQLGTKARSTVQRSKTTLGTVFAYAVRERLVNRNPVRDVRMPPGSGSSSRELVTFSDAELARTLELQNAIDPGYAEVTEFLSLTGLRWSELRALRLADLRQSPFPSVRVSRAHSDGYREKGTKTGRTRHVPLTARALEIATARSVDRVDSDYLFTGRMGRQLNGGLFRRFSHWAETAPAGRTIHDLRHYAASTWLRAGIPVHQVAQWLGHANPNTTLKVYAHVLGESQDVTAVERLNRLARDHAPTAAAEDLGIDGP